ncbi:MAG: hypothetical protein WDM81_11155 [Rhizomicrobium sp.]
MKSFGQKNTTFHLPGVARLREVCKGSLRVGGNDAGQGKVREFVADTQHEKLLKGSSFIAIDT